jgi:hypothetical protein
MYIKSYELPELVLKKLIQYIAIKLVLPVLQH